jgi:hypothetical protein
MNIGLTITIIGGALGLITSTAGVTYWVEHNKADRTEVASSVQDVRAEVFDARIRALQRDIRYIQELERRGQATDYDRATKQHMIDEIRFIEAERARLYKK